MNIILEGLSLSITGISITFAALGLLILTMIVLQRLFRSQSEAAGESEPVEKTVDSTLARDTEDDEVAAAIAVALVHLRSLDIGRSGLGTALEAGHGSWWTIGQIQHLPLQTRLTARAKPPTGTTPPAGTTHTLQGRRQQ